MRLTDAWRLGPSEVVAFVGGGGKTALMEALARDYKAEGARVVLTTTTKVRAPEPGGRRLLVADSVAGLMAALAADGRHSGVPGSPGPLVGRRVLPDRKVEGIPPEWVASLRDAPGVDAVLIEADGAAGRPLKAPAPWEPVVPDCASLVVAVAGLDAQSAPLDQAHVHRPELVSELLGVEPGSSLPPRALLDVLLRAYLPHVPGGAAFRVFLNKLDAHPVAGELAAASAASPVAVWAGAAGDAGAVATGEPVPLLCLRDVDRRPAAMVLAAGRATRMRGPKLLAPLGDTTVVGRVLAALTDVRDLLAEVIVVTGRGSEDVTAALGAFSAVCNPDPGAGQAGSLRVGLAAVPGDRDVLVVLADQPLVTGSTLSRVLDAHAAAPRAVAAGLLVEGEGDVRPPLVVHRSLRPRVLELEGDQGARSLLAAHRERVVVVPGSAAEGVDVDTPVALEYARTLLGAAAGIDRAKG